MNNKPIPQTPEQTQKVSINNIDQRMLGLKSKITKMEKILYKKLQELLKQKEDLINIKSSGYIKDDNGDIISIADSNRNINQELNFVEENIKDINKKLDRLSQKTLTLLQLKEKTKLPIMEYCVNIFDKIIVIFKSYNIEESNKLEKSLNTFFNSMPINKQPNTQKRLQIISFFKHHYHEIKSLYNFQKNKKTTYISRINTKTGKDAASGE